MNGIMRRIQRVSQFFSLSWPREGTLVGTIAGVAVFILIGGLLGLVSMEELFWSLEGIVALFALFAVRLGYRTPTLTGAAVWLGVLIQAFTLGLEEPVNYALWIFLSFLFTIPIKMEETHHSLERYQSEIERTLAESINANSPWTPEQWRERLYRIQRGY